MPGRVEAHTVRAMDTPCELARETWSRYFDELGSELRNADVSIEVIAAGSARQLEAGTLARQALSYDRRAFVG